LSRGRAGVGRWLVPTLAVGAAFLNEALFWMGEKYWFEERTFPAFQALYVGAWDGVLLAWFGWRQLRSPYFRRRAWLAVFWMGQSAWLGLGLWVFGGPLAAQPMAVAAAPGWLLGAVAWGLWVDAKDQPRLDAAELPTDSPYTDVLKALGRRKKG
jgi:hypothetical protein